MSTDKIELVGNERKFSFLGDEITWDVATDRYNSLRADYYVMSQEAEKAAKSTFEEKIDSVETLCDLGINTYEELFKGYLKKSVMKLVELGIYDIDEEALSEIVNSSNPLKYRTTLQSIINQVAEIDASVRAKQEAGQETVNSLLKGSGEMAGTGASELVTGNLYSSEGDFAAGMLDVTAGAVGLLAAGGAALYANHQNNKAQEEAVKSKSRIYNSESNRESIYTSFAQDVFELYEKVGRIANERLEDHGYYYYAVTEELEKLEPVCRNVLGGNFTDKPELEREMIFRILHTNPYDSRIYSYLIKKNGSITDELREIITYLSVDMKMLADTYLSEKYSIDEYETYESICEFENTVIEELKPFGIDNCKFYIEITNKKQKLFIVRCTFNDFIYDTIEERDKAEAQYNDLLGDIASLQEMNLDAVIEKYYATLPEDIYPKNREDLQTIYMGRILSCLTEITSSAMAEEYIVAAEQKRVEYQFEELSLIKELTKHKKKLETKEKMAETMAAAKEKASAVAGMAKDKGKELLSKVPFGKKKTVENADVATEQISTQEESVEASEPKENKKTGFGAMKNLFGSGKH